jgi:SPP1 gp7 family putative phage head morphogenesis protein
MPTRTDPTRTTALRKRFSREIRKRFRALRRAVIEFIAELDALGLSDRESGERLFNTSIVLNVEPRQFEFLTVDRKLNAFASWLEEQIEEKILNVDDPTGKPWTATYVESAHRQGINRGFLDARSEALSEAADFYEGTRSEFLRQAFSQPERLSKVRLLATRAFEELKGVGRKMAQDLNRELASAMVEGTGPRQVAREMSRSIDKLSRTRAELIARTEIIHAHAEGQLDSFQDLGIEEVGIKAEWSTAGDDRVCPDCNANEGKVYKVQEARGLIPLHPNCRCAWIPVWV